MIRAGVSGLPDPHTMAAVEHCIARSTRHHIALCQISLRHQARFETGPLPRQQGLDHVRHPSPVAATIIGDVSIIIVVARLIPVRQIRSHHLGSAISGFVAEISLTDVACNYL
jgi:hypothetical protein